MEWFGLSAGRDLSKAIKVRIVEGAFSDCLGLYEGMTDRERIAILLDLLGRKVRVLLASELVEVA